MGLGALDLTSSVEKKNLIKHLSFSPSLLLRVDYYMGCPLIHVSLIEN